MTSPQAATKDVVAAMASTEISHDDNPRPHLELHQVTAVNAEEDAVKNDHDSRERSATLPPEEPQENKELATIEEHAGDVQTQNGDLHLTMEAAIPDGANLIQDTQSGFPPMSTLDMDADTLNVLMMMNGGRFYDTAMNSLVGTVPIDGLGAMPPQMDGASQHRPYLDPSPYLHENDETRISAYAKVEFADGEFYMNTHQIILGRDLAAAQAAQRRDRIAEQLILEEEKNEEKKAAEPKTPIRINREGSRHGKSVISDSGGILMEGDDYDSDERARRKERRLRKSRKSTTGSSSQHVSMSRRSSLAMPDAHIVYHAQPQVRRAAPVTSGGVPVDLASLRPSPHDCPLVGIHPPASEPYSKYKAISRQHVKIAFNAKKHLFEAIIIGRNGAFIDDLFYHGDSVVPLKSGSSLQIGPVYMRFVLPDIAIGETGAEQRVEYEECSPNSSRLENRCSAGGKEMSLEFDDDGRRNADSSDDESGQDQQITLGEGEEREDENELEDEEEEREQEEWEDMDADGEDEEETNGYALAESVEEDNHQPIQSADVANTGKPPKKRGPGRPPKNGVRSKREEQLAKKEALAQEKAKKTVPQPSETGKENKDGKVKNKVGRPRKHPRPDTPPIKTEKRKYTKRKPKEPADPNAPKQEGEGEEKKPKKEKPVRPPRSPTPQYDVDQLTEEQKSKPPQNYVQLIYDALRESATGQMSLPQIYRSMQRKYPYFVVSTTTSGWQSSVRHNLSQNSAFEKTQRDGKGWMWAIKAGATIEKEKKRQKTPPAPAYPQYQQPIYTGAPWFPQGQYPQGQYPPGQYPLPVYGMQPNYGPGQMHPQYVQGPPPQMNGHPIPGPHPPMNVQPVNGQPIPGYPTPLPPQLNAPGPGLSAAPGGGTYRSPYAPDPNPNTAASPQPSSTQPQSDQQQPQPGGNQTPYQSQYPTAGTSSAQGPPPMQGMQIHPGTQDYPVSTSSQPSTQDNNPAPHPAPPAQGPSSHSTLGQPGVEVHSPAPLPSLAAQNSPKHNSSDPATTPHSQPSISADSEIIQEFRNAMVEGLKAKTDNPEALVDSAIHRVLKASTESIVPENQRQLEANIMEGLRQLLEKHEQSTSKVQNKQQSSFIPGNDNELSVKPSQSPHPSEEKSGATVMQPPLVGQAQSRPSVPRPPMMGMKRTNSDSQASSRLSQTPSASPAPTKGNTNEISHSTIGAKNDTAQNTGQVSTPTMGASDIMSTFETTQVIGQKRSLSDADDAREFKRECTSGPPTT